jgi:protein TIF31
MQDIRQSIIEFPGTLQYSCFHLEHNGERINDYVELSEIKELARNSTFTLVEDPYTEKDARLHFMRVRELVGASGDKTETVSGISAGTSFFDSIGKISTKDGTSQDSTDPGDGESSHPMSGYSFSSPGDPTKLIPPTTKPAPKTLKFMSLSPWNPPPYHLRQRGHLIYLQVTTNEGEQHQITGNVGGFYVNKSSNSKFDPFPRSSPKNVSAHSLLSLFDQISSSFASSFVALQQHSNQREPLATFALTNAIPVSPWLVSAPKSTATSHVPDITRSQESYLLSGMEYVETLRDWNEEFQSTRELPTDTVQERVFRERLSSKLFADYNEAATRGAVLIARGEVAPLNPTEGKDAQIFVYNNIFFSFGADGAGTFTSEGGDDAARVATGKDVAGVKTVNQLDVKGLFTPGTVIVDYLGKRIVCQSIVPGIFKQRGPDEPQIDYGAVDGKETVANNVKFDSAFQTLSDSLRVKPHPVWDKDGKRHDLEGNVETKGLIGTDGRKYVLDLYRITPLDIAWIDECWHELPSTTGTKMTNETTTDDAYPHRMSVLRMDLVLDLYRMKAIEYISKEKEKNRKEALNGHITTDDEQAEKGGSNEVTKSEELEKKVSESEEKPVDLSKFEFALNGDVFSGQVPQTEEEKEQWAQDEADVREACAFLRDTVIPRLIHDLKEAEVGFPLDGASLTRLLHKRGINVRYLGKIVRMAEIDGPRLSALKAIGIQDMVARAFKNVTNRRLRHLPTPFASTCISHFLNCLLGSDFNPSPSPDFDEVIRPLFPDADFSFDNMTPDTIRSEIKQQVASRFQYNLADDWHSTIKHPQLLREIALKLGLQLEAKEYHFSNPSSQLTANGKNMSAITNGAPKTPLANGHATGGSKKKRKGGEQASPPSSVATGLPKASTTFVPEDIVNIVPIIKDAAPKSTMADEAFEAGKLSLSNDQKELGQELLLESLSLHEQIYGILHPEVARFYMNLSMLYYQLDEKLGAAEIARKAVIVAERTLGIDSVETILAYLNLGLYEHATGNTSPALAYVRHALELWKIVYGAKHPDSITTTNNAAVMLQHLKHYHDSRLWFEESLVVSEEMFGKDSENTATLLFQLAQALVLDHDSKASVKRMREAYNIFLSRFGPEDRNTKEAENWLEQLTQNAVSIAKHAKDLQTRKLRRVQLNPRVTLGTRTQPQVGQSSTSDQTEPSTKDIGLDSRSVEELIKFIEGGGDPSKMGQKKKKTSRSNPKRRGGAAVSAHA